MRKRKELIADGIIVFFILYALTFLFFLSRPFAQTIDDVKKTFNVKACSDPCVIRENEGGNIAFFRSAGHDALNLGRRIVVDGPCFSSCVVLVDVARENVCITPRATFGFHMGYQWSNDGMLLHRIDMRNSHSRDIADWITKRGGLPADGFLFMDFQQAQSFWRVCPSTLHATR